MNIELEPGKYVLAVSGGVDSVVLLDLLSRLSNVELVVAHFDHGIRANSKDDQIFVEKLASDYRLPFVYGEGRLGANASEAAARQARYEFLDKLRKEHKADAIVTAHHQDDVLETAIINLLRGTGRKGLSALDDRADIRRPLLKTSKSEIINYACQHDLRWREDSTNSDQKYLRNYVRHSIVSRFSEADKQKFLDLLEKSRSDNKELDAILAGQFGDNDNLDRQWFNHLPHAAALEIMAAWLREQGVRDFDSQTLDRLVVAAKTGRDGQKFDVLHGVIMNVGKHNLALAQAER
jgi:tRNA(Ile)-lysidine synthase